jgi:hypothetical protein
MNHTIKTRKNYRSIQALVELSMTLAERDLEILNLVELLTVVSGSQIRKLCFERAGRKRTDPQLARRALRRLTNIGLLHRLQRRIGGSRSGSDAFLYCLAADGTRLMRHSRGYPVGRGRLWSEPGQRTLDHRLAVSQLYVDLAEAIARRDDAELIDFATEPASWRRYLGPGADERTLKPDAFARIGVGDVELIWWIEIDRGTVSQRTRSNQAAQYREYWQSGAAGDVMPRVLWVTRTVALADQVVAAIDLNRPPAGLFVIATPGTVISLALELSE